MMMHTSILMLSELSPEILSVDSDLISSLTSIMSSFLINEVSILLSVAKFVLNESSELLDAREDAPAKFVFDKDKGFVSLKTLVVDCK